MRGVYRWCWAGRIVGAAVAISVGAAQAEAPGRLSAASQSLVAGQVALGVALVRDLCGSGRGVSLSPYSVHAAVSLARIGARGSTAQELDKILALGTKPEAVLDSYGELNASVLSVPGGDADSAIALADSIWLSKSITVLPGYLARATGAFGAQARSVDFNDPATTRVINSWVSDVTRGLIPELLKGPLEPSTLAALVNALYLKAAWVYPFQKEGTQDGPFWLSDREQIVHPLMRQTFQASHYYENSEWQVAGLPLARGRLQLLVLLPKAKRGADAVAQRISAGLIAKARSAGRPQKLDVVLPAFKVQARPDVERYLRAQAPLSFGPKADFAALAEEPIRISSVVHEAVVSVDEKGIEAAAATAVMMVASAAPFGKPEEPLRFTVDHPFAYVLTHVESGAPLFLGIVSDPREP